MMNLKNIKAIILNILIYIFLPTFITYILAKFNYPHHKLFLNFYNLIPAIITLIIMLKLNKDLFIDKKKDWQKNYSHYMWIYSYESV